MDIKLPRYWKKTIRELTGLQFCDKNCDCGEDKNNQLWWFPPGQYAGRYLPEWVPSWMNGADSYDIWRWLVENGRDRKTIR